MSRKTFDFIAWVAWGDRKERQPPNDSDVRRSPLSFFTASGKTGNMPIQNPAPAMPIVRSTSSRQRLPIGPCSESQQEVVEFVNLFGSVFPIEKRKGPWISLRISDGEKTDGRISAARKSSGFSLVENACADISIFTRNFQRPREEAS